MTRMCRVEPDLLPQLGRCCRPPHGDGDEWVMQGGAGLAAPARRLMSTSSEEMMMGRREAGLAATVLGAGWPDSDYTLWKKRWIDYEAG